MLPSEVEIIWKRFQEVNKVFFQLLKKAELGDIVKAFRSAFISDFFAQLVASSKQDTPTPSTTDTSSSG